MRLNEMKGKGKISDRLYKLFKECKDALNSIGYNIENDILLESGDTSRTFGATYWPVSIYNQNFTIVLNKYMENEPDDAIKNTIYHELCHYINMKQQIEDGIFYWANNYSLKASNKYNNTRDRSHGIKWQNIAKDVTNKLKLPSPITRVNNYTLHPGVGQEAENKYKYIIKCKHCGYTFKFIKKTGFVKDVLEGNGKATNWHCNCSDGYKSKDFEIVKGG